MCFDRNCRVVTKNLYPWLIDNFMGWFRPDVFLPNPSLSYSQFTAPLNPNENIFLPRRCEAIDNSLARSPVLVLSLNSEAFTAEASAYLRSQMYNVNNIINTLK